MALSPITPSRKTGSEPFHDGPKDAGFDLRSFWQWSVFDLVSNATRGILAEYIVARAWVPIRTASAVNGTRST